MILNNAGEMIKKWWMELKNKFNNIILDENIVMPNHLHGIIIIQNNNSVGAILCNRPHNEYHENIKNTDGENTEGENIVSPLRQITNLYNGLGQYISWFKRLSTNEYIRNVKLGKFPRFEKSIWQRNYYEHIIRDEKSLNQDLRSLIKKWLKLAKIEFLLIFHF